MRFVWSPMTVLLIAMCARASESPRALWGGLEPGPQGVGFRLIRAVDPSRVYPRHESGSERPWSSRELRMYVWYPTQDSSTPPLALKRFAAMAAEDFDLIEAGQPLTMTSPPLPVPLAQGLTSSRLKEILETGTASHLDAPASPGRFPVLVLGQGLYYESPLSQLVLSEFLASWGYVVVTCPLKGTRYRLVNLNVTDLETITRDLEFVLGQVLLTPYADPDHVGVVGYDMGGMAGLALTMRNPRITAFISLDAGILYPHFSGLPQAHFSYDLARMSTAWLHMTQARFVEAFRSQGGIPNAMQARPFGDNYLLSMNSTNHGGFTSYAMFGIEAAVPGYWEAVQTDPRPVYEAICQVSRRFFDACLKGSQDSREWLRQSPEQWQLSGAVAHVERRAGRPGPAVQQPWIDRLIRDGAERTLPALRAAQSQHPNEQLVSEEELNWLGYHLLYWWGRPAEAIPVFQYSLEAFPDSANAVDSLAEAYLVLGNRAEAIRYYRRSLEMNPDNQNAQTALKRLLNQP